MTTKPKVTIKKPTTPRVKAAQSTIRTRQAAVEPSPEGFDPNQPITGRGIFAVRTMGDAVSVEAAFLAQDGNVVRMPAVFPNREYALAQIDELRQIVNRHFDELEQSTTLEHMPSSRDASH